MKNSSWNNVSKWYSKTVGDKGLYFHQNVIFPYIQEIIIETDIKSVLDLACGQGILSTIIPNQSKYLGIDLAKGLIEEAKKNYPHREYLVRDISKPLDIQGKYDLITIVLALQNIEDIKGVFENISKYISNNGKCIVILNHPYFRIPKSTSWEIEKETGNQYRRVVRYMSKHKIRLDMNPGSKKEKEYTYSYHHPLGYISTILKQKQLYISEIIELVSNKESQGKYKEQEDFARREFPLFMALEISKYPQA